MRILGAAPCLKLFPLATIFLKTHVSSRHSSSVSKASPGELHFYFGASLVFQGAEKEFGSFGPAGNPLPNFCFFKPYPFVTIISNGMTFIHFDFEK
jgi:hypothetical protein